MFQKMLYSAKISLLRKLFIFLARSIISFSERHQCSDPSESVVIVSPCDRSESFLRSRRNGESLEERGKLVILRATSRDVSLSFHAGLNLLTSHPVNKLSPQGSRGRNSAARLIAWYEQSTRSDVAARYSTCHH